MLRGTHANLALRRTTAQLRSRLGQRFASTSGEASSSSSSFLKTVGKISLYTSVAGAAYTIGSLYPPTLATYISPRPAPAPLHPEAPEAVAYVESLEDTLQRLPLLQRVRETTSPDEWYEARPYAKIPRERRINSLTAGSLNGPGKLALAPLVRAKRDNSEGMVFVHVGSALCGHEGIVHGGLLATLLDETLGRQALINLPEKIGVTAYLHLTYKAPTRADQFLVIKTRLIEAKGRKSKVAGAIEDMDGNVLVEAEALFIQPKYAKLLNTARMRELIGEPENSREPIGEGANAPVPVSPPSGPPLVRGARA
ncbi:Thioesterase/thiol ester dehydrase-isomerase [Rhodofomes roseus]|uniref:Thioesterase/thiol ester dehydrase-isomerase n=1 Tax=Rhodofomes roseus TaxID=34475 RepID=A0ABQ8KJ10_9APHY|nr:Thioesterase/thiol ester dehydrase-isomerase [Rhodofomes roseus]KAH9837995.1 Thioesterase/thiol ester dehydrase-isomerase [Rhodofomes roseus]